MTPAAMAGLHAACFPPGARPAPWDAAGFAAMLGRPGALTLTAPDALLVGCVTLDEAELLTLAVAPAARRQGRGAALLRRFAAAARERGALRGYLEVAADNPAARALYAAQGWAEAGCRRNYYGLGRDALVLRLDLSRCRLPST